MVLCAHSDAVFHTESKGHSRAGDHMFLSENNAMPRWNGSVLTLSQIVKFVVSSALEAELGSLFIISQEMVEMKNTLEEIKWPHTKSPIQAENSAAAGVINNTIVPSKLKTIKRHLHWLRCREAFLVP